jgi:hypothetical protein
MRGSWRLTNAIVAAMGASVACGDRGGDAPVVPPSAASAAGTAVGTAPAPTPHVADRRNAPCADPALHYEDGVARGWLCPPAAAALGLTLVDLSEQWAPRPFAPGPDGSAPRFRDTYLALAAERDPDGGELPIEEKLVEMYGVTPAPSVVLRRLRDAERHACHEAIDDTPLARVGRTLREAPNGVLDAAERKRRYLATFLERERARRKLPDLDALAALPAYAHQVKTWRRLETERAAVLTAQQHLVCNGLLPRKRADGRLTWYTADKLDLYQRMNFLLPHGELDADTREALAAGGIELDFRAALRLLRERVVDATGLLEDGTAGPGPLPVLGRQLEPERMTRARGHAPLPNGAPDLIGPATEVAARALGWLTPEAARDWLGRHAGEQLWVALALPPPPAYHSSHMDLRAEIDRGDVWYDLKPRARAAQRRPALTIFAKDGEQELALVRWPTTIGGWADEMMPGRWVKKKWKESDVGKRLWKDLYIAPTWQPPETTPDAELMRYEWWNQRWRVKHEIFGPGPRSAYGMVMLIHHRPVKSGKNKVYWADNGIRTHGTSGVTSVVRGTSHGCHRTLNHLAVRLGSFLIRHRDHEVRGDQRAGYRRILRHTSGVYPVRVDTRGYLYELTPPVEIEVTKGRIRSPRKIPPPR